MRLLNQVESALAGVNDVRLQITVARDELLASQHRVVERVEALHPKVDEILRHVQKPDVWPGNPKSLWLGWGRDQYPQSHLGSRRGRRTGPAGRR